MSQTKAPGVLDLSCFVIDRIKDPAAQEEGTNEKDKQSYWLNAQEMRIIVVEHTILKELKFVS